jgi:hypothetical protein
MKGKKFFVKQVKQDDNLFFLFEYKQPYEKENKKIIFANKKT